MKERPFTQADFDKYLWSDEFMKDAYQELAERIAANPRMRQILDKANQDYDGFALWIADILRAEGVYQLPAGILEALNSGDGTYRP